MAIGRWKVEGGYWNMEYGIERGIISIHDIVRNHFAPVSLTL